MYVLGIESSCDETSAAIVTDQKKICSNVIYSQIGEHSSFSGVVPEIAARAHLDKIDKVFKKSLSDAQISADEISAVAATCGPGLIGGLIVGSTFAKTLAWIFGVPFIAINHIEAHALSARLTNDIEFPYLLMLASGGHCQLCIVYSASDIEVIGKTLDDSIGEAFDKVAKMLGLGYPGGPAIEKAALLGNGQRFKLPRPLCTNSSCNFSFSGLKTAVLNIARQIKNEDNASTFEKDVKNASKDDLANEIENAKGDAPNNCEHELKNDLCASFQRTAIEVLEYKIRSALKVIRRRGIEITGIVISGGVAANKAIREAVGEIAQTNALPFFCPPINLCTDNAAMIAWLGVEKFQTQHFSPLDFAPTPRWAFSCGSEIRSR